MKSENTLTDTAIGYRIALRDCIIKAKQLSKEDTIYEIDFDGHIKAQFQITSSRLEVIQAINGYGDLMDVSKFIFSSFPKQPKQPNKL